MKNYLFIFSLFILGCATTSMPTGGPKDEAPPELLESNPTNNQKNFKGASFEFTFNEDIQLKDVKEEILIIPSLGKETKFVAKKRNLIITPQYELTPNTTYTINFREGVRDLTEGNPAENLRIAFSTGPEIDSLSISGKIKNMFSEKTPEKITIALYQSDTFNIFDNTPTYFTKSNKEGEFLLPNLKSGQYFIYAFDDKNKNLKVDSKSEKFSFQSQPLNLTTNIDSIDLSLINIDSRPLQLLNIRNSINSTRVKFNKQLDSISISGLTQKNALYYFGTDQSELIFHQFFIKDSVKVNLYAIDSIVNSLDTTIYLKNGEIKSIEESLKSNEKQFKYSHLTKRIEHIIQFNKPITTINYDSMFIEYDSINTQNINSTEVFYDSITNTINIKSEVKEIENSKTNPITISYRPGSFISIENDSSKTISKKFTVPKTEDLGTIIINVNTNEANYVIQLIDDKGEIIQTKENTKDFSFKLLEPKEYKLRAIIDSNKNHKWDPGNFFMKIDPEKIVYYFNEEGKTTIPVRANWDVGPLLIKF